MKTILVPTDFSPSADNAALFASHLARQVGAGLLLVHVYQIPVTMNDMPVMVVSAEELRSSADQQLDRQRNDLLAQFPDLQVRVESRLGSINDELEQLCTENDPLAIVLGSHGMSALERMLFGSTTISVMRHTQLPVIAVPKDYKRLGVRKIALAADLIDIEKIPAQKIVALTQAFGAQLDLVHVASRSEAENKNAAALMQHLQPLQPQYHTVFNDDVKTGLLQYIDQHETDLLMVLPHEHNIMERLFFKLHTDDIVKNAPLPVMAIRS